MSAVERYQLTPQHSISRVIKGGWQLAGGHGAIDREQALEDMRLYVDAGITTFDCADIYTGVEEFIGLFLRRYQSAIRRGTLPPVQVHTKMVPDLDDLTTLTRRQVEAIVDRSLRRLGVERLDLVQLHWWDFEIPGYVEAALQLEVLRQAGKVKHLALTNFDVPHLQEILEAGVAVTANQVQYSLLDRRPEGSMVPFCAKRGIALLCYGTLAGGFLSDRYLGAPEPQPPLENRSLTKYKLIIDEFGGWDLFQRLLTSLQTISRKHGVSIAVVASRAILQKEGVAAAIVGVRHARHLPDTLRVFDFELDAQDLAALRGVMDLGRGPSGDVYSVERIKGGPHAAVMKYNLGRKWHSPTESPVCITSVPKLERTHAVDIKQVYTHYRRPAAHHGEYRFCPSCGARTARIDEGHVMRPRCPVCGFTQYRNPAPTVSVLVADGGRVLLGRRGGEPGRGTWSLPSGYIEFGDDFLTTAVRETREETGLKVELRSLLNVVSSFVSPRFHFLNLFLVAHVVGGELEAGDDLEAVAWYPLAGPFPPMGFPEDEDALHLLASGFVGLPIDPAFTGGTGQ